MNYSFVNQQLLMLIDQIQFRTQQQTITALCTNGMLKIINNFRALHKSNCNVVSLTPFPQPEILSSVFILSFLTPTMPFKGRIFFETFTAKSCLIHFVTR